MRDGHEVGPGAGLGLLQESPEILGPCALDVAVGVELPGLGRYEAETRLLLESSVVRDDSRIFSALALNDVVVNRSGISGMVELAVSVDGYFMYNQRSDGLIVSTATGSTASRPRSMRRSSGASTAART